MTTSLWLRQAPPAAPRTPLAGDAEADVCIVGGGYTGLWTAYELKRAEPSLAVTVLEAEHVGYGASGRNGGWVYGRVAGTRDPALDRAIRATVDEVGAVAAREGIDCDFVKGGQLTVAQTPLQLERVRGLVALDRALGATEEESRLLGAREVEERVAVRAPLGARFLAECARVQPAALARGLGAAAERAGVVIHESTTVRAIAPGLVTTWTGTVRARFVVRATEGYTARLPGLRRALLPLRSCMVATERLSERDWDALGWQGCETILDGLHRYAYLQRTADGRIAIGGRGVPYRYASRTDERPLEQRTIEELRGRITNLFPQLRDVGVADAWHGVLGVARDWNPAVGIDRGTGIAWAGGYAGDGVAASNLAGRTLRDLLLGRDTELTRLPWVRSFGRQWEPEPLRWLGVHAVYGLFAAADRRENRTSRPALAARLARRVAGMS